MQKLSKTQIASVVTDALRKQPIVDMHTHTYPPTFGTPVPNASGAVDKKGLLLWGVASPTRTAYCSGAWMSC
jgi:hypothetical protein